MLIGHGGQCARGIAYSTGSKIRIRGRGSGHLEVDGKKEAPVPLMIAISVPKSSAGGLRSAVEQTIELLLTTAQSFVFFCQARGLSSKLYHMPLVVFGKVSKGSESVLRDLMVQFSMTPVDGKLSFFSRSSVAGVDRCIFLAFSWIRCVFVFFYDPMCVCTKRFDPPRNQKVRSLLHSSQADCL